MNGNRALEEKTPRELPAFFLACAATTEGSGSLAESPDQNPGVLAPSSWTASL